MEKKSRVASHENVCSSPKMISVLGHGFVRSTVARRDGSVRPRMLFERATGKKIGGKKKKKSLKKEKPFDACSQGGGQLPGGRAS